jgi:hypothetical protein
MQKIIGLLVTLCAFAIIAFGVFKAGELAMSDQPILALIPVTALLFGIIFYIRMRDKKD